jgi:thiopeptide-type bacteriocin biosynthesis protein
MKSIQTMNSYSYLPGMMLRVPSYANNGEITRSVIDQFLKDPFFLEALWIASKDLYDAAVKIDSVTDEKKLEKLELSLAKYINRTKNRTTPFGLFAGCMPVAWGKNTDITLGEIAPHTRLDMGVFCNIYRELLKLSHIRSNLSYSVNKTIYRVGSNFRMVDYKTGAYRNYTISSIEATDYLHTVYDFCSTNQPYLKIANFIKYEFDIDIEEASAFLDELIDGQFLLSELEPQVSGAEYIDQVVGTLQRLIKSSDVPSEFYPYLNCFQNIKTILGGSDTSIIKKELITGTFKDLLPQINLDGLFQIDLFWKGQHRTLEEAYGDKILEAVDFLNKVTPKHPNSNLRAFIKRFEERYDGQEVSLLEALDPESGIGYAANTNLAGDAPLVHRMYFSSGPAKEIKEAHYTDVIQWLITYINSHPDHNAVDLQDCKLNLLNTNWDAQLPPTFSVMFRLYGAEQKSIYLEHCGWQSGACMFGRFGNAVPEFRKLLEEVNEVENEFYHDELVAEVVHLPEDRFGNVASRPDFRNYHIPVLAGSNPSLEEIMLSDLTISVVAGALVLKSKKLKKRIHPRISNAHNFALKALPVYHFLGDLQGAESKFWLGLNVEVLPKIGMVKIPRLHYKDVILSLQTWYFKADDLNSLREAHKRKNFEQIRDFFNFWGIPDVFVYADDDNELLVHRENILEISAWLSACKKNDEIVLKECIDDMGSAILKDKRGNGINTQFVAVLKKTLEKRSTTENSLAKQIVSIDPLVKRRFFPGEEWLYVKLYCGVKTADQLIGNEIMTIGKTLIDSELADQWFFIRYNDPEPHIRFRVHLKSTRLVGEVVDVIQTLLKKQCDARSIWKLQFDTYEREIERYHSGGIEISEQLFYYDSVAVSSFISRKEMMDSFEESRWLWGIHSIDCLLNDFDFSITQKIEMMDFLSSAFHKEFNSDVLLSKQLSARYRHYKTKIATIFNQAENFHGADLLQYRSLNTIPLAILLKSRISSAQVSGNIYSYLSSYIHMNTNRLFKTKHRIHELVVYDFLLKYYKSTFYKEKYSA